MARTRRKPKPPTRYRRCQKCHALIPSTYLTCECGYNANDDLFNLALQMFPGSHEVYGTSHETTLDEA